MAIYWHSWAYKILNR